MQRYYEGEHQVTFAASLNTNSRAVLKVIQVLKTCWTFWVYLFKLPVGRITQHFGEHSAI